MIYSINCCRPLARVRYLFKVAYRPMATINKLIAHPRFKSMIILGIEGSANKLGVGIVNCDSSNISILANPRKTFVPPPGHGFIPALAAAHHREKILDLVQDALNLAGIDINKVDLFAYTRGPGIRQSLVVAATVVRTLGLLFNKPVIPVNHCVAHIEMGRFVTKAINPVILYASGGNTQIIAYSDGRYKIFGETLDVAVGNCLDKIARELGLSNDPSPGQAIEEKARGGRRYFELPYTIKGMDMSFSGVLGQAKCLAGERVEDVCFSVQETVFSVLVEGTERCMAFTGADEVLVVGGVGCNQRLQEMIGKMAEGRKARVYAMDERYCIDNGAMIAYTGLLMHLSGGRWRVEDCDVTQRFRTDSVFIAWRES